MVRPDNLNPAIPADEVVEILLADNAPPSLFRMGKRTAVRLRSDEGGAGGNRHLYACPYDHDGWLIHVTHHVDFVKENAAGDQTYISPPQPDMR
jgi:hypothetical protein